MGRKKISKETVVVDVNGTLMAWTDGYFSGEQKLINQAKLHAGHGDAGVPVTVALTRRGPEVTPRAHTALGAAAALIAIDPGKSRIVSAPDHVLEAIDAALEPAMAGVADTTVAPGDITAHLKSLFPDD